MKFNLPGRVRHTQLHESHPLAPLYETIVNSIDAIEECSDRKGAGQITVKMLREGTKQGVVPNAQLEGRVRAFAVEDDGSGFNAGNFESFETSDSDLKRARGGKGVGRFLWLKAFERVHIESAYRETDGIGWRRTFDFALPDGIVNPSLELANPPFATIVQLDGMHEEFQRTCPKTVDAIGRGVMGHCMSYLVSGRCPRIVITDGATTTVVNELYEAAILGQSSAPQHVTVGGEQLAIRHMRFRPTSDEVVHRIHYWADRRDVVSRPLEKLLPDLDHRLLDNQDRPFVLASFVSGNFFDSKVDPERVRFMIPQKRDVDLLPDEITWEQIEGAVLGNVKEELGPHLTRARERKLKRVEAYVKTRAPQYRPILRWKPEALDSIKVNVSDDALELELHKLAAQAEAELKETGQKLLKKEPQDLLDIDEVKQEYIRFIDQMNDFGKASLAHYIVHRKVVLDFLARSLALRMDNGRYALEKNVHELIFPLRSTSEEIRWERQNLWIIDERLTYHEYLASDEALTAGTRGNRPDLLIFHTPIVTAEPEAGFSRGVTIIEFKRPMREDFPKEKDNPFVQVYDYVRRIKAGEVTTRTGRPLEVPPNTPFYATVIVDLVPEMRKMAVDASLRTTPDARGYYGWNPELLTYVEVLSYDTMVEDAKRRNRVLFDKLQLPITPGPR